MGRGTLVRVRDGRELRVVEAGPPDGVPVVVHHGTPGAAGFLDQWVADAERRGLRLLSCSRPGYDGSSRAPGRTVASVAADVADVLDALGVRDFVTWGTSGGGPHALACAALLPERVRGVATLAGVGPYDMGDVDFLDGMGPGNIEEFGAAVRGEEALRPLLEGELPGLLGGGVAEFVEGMKPFLTDVDERELSGELGAQLLESMQRGLADGVDGWVDDDLAFVRQWGFAVEDVSVPWLVLQGREDAMVPLSHGQWLAQRARQGEARLTEEDGHLTLLTRRVADVHAWLADRWAESAVA